MRQSRRTPESPDNRRFESPEAIQAMSLLARRADQLQALTPHDADFLSTARIALDRAAGTVRDVFGPDSIDARTFWAALIQVDSDVAMRPYGDPRNRENVKRQSTEACVKEAVARLRSLISTVDERTEVAVHSFSNDVPANIGRRIFVVHGHNEGVKQAVARTLERLELDPIILHERPDKGRTIIEKFKDYADVGFAVVLMTGDDRGGEKEVDPKAYGLRARQNVVLELGFFLGRLRPDQVCVLYEPGVELPSDYSGVLFTELDAAGAWKYQLAGEIDAAGIHVDLNLLKR